MDNVDNKVFENNQAQIEILKINLAYLNSLLVQRSSILPVIASLSATMLVVATFNEDLVPLTEDIRVALVILLILVPISVIISILELHFAIDKTVNHILKSGGKDPYESKSWLGKFGTILMANTPLIFSVILSIIIGWIIFVVI